MFGRSSARGAEDRPVEPVAWEDVRQFVVGSVERRDLTKRTRSVWGKPAVRVPQGDKTRPTLAPCAYLGSSSAPSLPSEPRLTLFEDEDMRRLLCYVARPQEVDGERHHLVHDGQGQPIGTLRRVPPKRPFKHTWRIDQPDRPEIVGRNEWVSGGAREVAGRVTGRFLPEIVDDLLSPHDGDEQARKGRTLEWRAGNETVMTSEGSTRVHITADWIDRRLAFAFALVGDK